MKAYGSKRIDTAYRTMRGSSRPCPCCMLVRPSEKDVVGRARRKAERARARKEILDITSEQD